MGYRSWRFLDASEPETHGDCITNAVSVSAHPDGYQSLAVTVSQGTNLYYGWGYNDNGQVGNGSGADQQITPAQLHFCNACSSCVQLGTSGIFTAQCTGTLTLYFNDEVGAFPNNFGSYTATVNGSATDVTVMATNDQGVPVGIVTNGGVYFFSASGLCGWDNNFTNQVADANGSTNSAAPVDCATLGASDCVCPAAQCFSLVGRIQ